MGLGVVVMYGWGNGGWRWKWKWMWMWMDVVDVEIGGLLGRSIPALLCWRLIYRSLRIRGKYSRYSRYSR